MVNNKDPGIAGIIVSICIKITYNKQENWPPMENTKDSAIACIIV